MELIRKEGKYMDVFHRTQMIMKEYKNANLSVKQVMKTWNEGMRELQGKKRFFEECKWYEKG